MCPVRRPLPDERHHPRQVRGLAGRTGRGGRAVRRPVGGRHRAARLQERIHLRGSVVGNGNGNGNGKVEASRERIGRGGRQARGSSVWESVLRPGSPFKKGYTDTPRNRSYVIMNNVLYHLHPVKVKRHGVRLSYTLCLGGLSFFLFILLTITGIFLMFYYTPYRRPGLRRYPGALHQRRLRLAGEEHAPLGRPPHGAHRSSST